MAQLESLRVDNRVAKENPEGRAFLLDLLCRELPLLADAAIEISFEDGDPIGQLLAEAVRHRDDPELAARLLESLGRNEYSEVWSLRELGAACYEIVLRGAVAEETFPADAVAALRHNLGALLATLGRWPQARQLIFEAIAFYSGGSPTSSAAAHRAALAACWNTLTQIETRLGRLEEAVGAARRAVELALQLEPPAPLTVAGYRSDLAAALADLGFSTESLAEAEQAVQAYRDLPDPYDVTRATALVLLGNNLVDFGRYEEAAAALDQAVKILEVVASERGDQIVPTLGLALGDVAVLEARLGRETEALETACRACEALEKLWSVRPYAFLADFLWTLDLLSGNRLERSAGSGIDIHDLTQRCLSLIEEAGEDRAAYEPLKVKGLALLAQNQIWRSRFTAGIRTAREALRLLGQLPEESRQACEREELWLQLGLSRAYGQRGKVRQAAAAAELAMTLAGRTTRVSEIDRAAALDLSAIWLFKLGRAPEAESALRQAIAILGASKAPPTFERAEQLAISLNHLGILLNAAGDHAGAIQLAAEAFSRLEPWPESERITETRIMSLSNWGLFLFHQQSFAEAEARLRQSLELWDSLKAEREEAREFAAQSLHALGTVLEFLGRREEAEQRYRQSWRLHVEILEEGIESSAEQLGFTLYNLGGLLIRDGRQEEGKELQEQALLWMARGQVESISEAVVIPLPQAD